MLDGVSNFGKSVMEASSALKTITFSPPKVLRPIQIVSNPLHKAYFVNYNTAGKVSYFKARFRRAMRQLNL